MAAKISPRPAKRRPKQPASRRVEKVEATRRQLFDAALKVVGESGYAGSSISKIAARAKVAQGTFYNYFTSQQDVFDQLLPYLGERLLNRIREKLEGCSDAYEREAIGFRAYFDFLSENPEFERILSEAAVFTPQGFRNHVKNIVNGYMRAFRYSRARGALPHYSERELEAVTYMLLGARAYLSQRFMANGDGRAAQKLPEWAFTAYMKFMRYGLTGPRRGRASTHKPELAEISDTSVTEPDVLEATATHALVRAAYDPERTELTSLLARMATLAARAALTEAQRVLQVSHFSCNILGPELPDGSVLRAAASVEGRSDRPVSISIRFEIETSPHEIFATAQMLSV